MSKFRHDLAFQPVRRMPATKIALIAVSMGMEKKENPLVRAIVSDDQLPQAERSVVVATEFLGMKFADLSRDWGGTRWHIIWPLSALVATFWISGSM